MITTKEQIDILFKNKYYGDYLKTQIDILKLDDENYLDVIGILNYLIEIKKKELELIEIDIKIVEGSIIPS